MRARALAYARRRRKCIAPLLFRLKVEMQTCLPKHNHHQQDSLLDEECTLIGVYSLPVTKALRTARKKDLLSSFWHAPRISPSCQYPSGLATSTIGYYRAILSRQRSHAPPLPQTRPQSVQSQFRPMLDWECPRRYVQAALLMPAQHELHTVDFCDFQRERPPRLDYLLCSDTPQAIKTCV